MCSISKRIGDIRLSDFKALFDRPGFYRYHFKAVDQEFGMVKEEVGYDKYIDVSQEKHYLNLANSSYFYLFHIIYFRFQWMMPFYQERMERLLPG